MSRYISKHTGSEIDAAIDRAKAGGAIDTLLAGKAPAGYGLGESSTYDNLISDCNQATKNGWYWTYENVQNAPMDYGFLHVCCNGSYIKQEWWVTGTMGVLMAIRVCNSGTWMPWEWVNPLMQLGGIDADGNSINEYRTTERYMGKPVYVKLVNFGALPNATSKNVEYSTETSCRVIEAKGNLEDGTGPSIPGTIGASTNQVIDVGGNGRFVWVTTYRDYSSKTAYIRVKYYKTTD